MSAFTVRVPDATVEQLDRLAEKQERSRAWLAAKAIEEFVAREEWQIAEIEAGLAEAEAGDFAKPQDVAAILARYARPQR